MVSFEKAISNPWVSKRGKNVDTFDSISKSVERDQHDEGGENYEYARSVSVNILIIVAMLVYIDVRSCHLPF